MAETHSRQLLLNIRPQGQPTFDNYVVGGNGELMSALRRFVSGGLPAMYLWGAEGSGRSHLAHAMARQHGTDVLNGAEVGGELSPAEGGLVIVDDVEGLSPEAQIALFRCFNDARVKKLKILVSGGVAPRNLPCREDLRTRIGQALIYEIKPLTDAEKASALLYHAAQRGMRVDDHIVDYLLRHGRRDLPSLMATLDALDRFSLEQQRPVTLPLLREILQMQPE